MKTMDTCCARVHIQSFPTGVALNLEQVAVTTDEDIWPGFIQRLRIPFAYDRVDANVGHAKTQSSNLPMQSFRVSERMRWSSMLPNTTRIRAFNCPWRPKQQNSQHHRHAMLSQPTKWCVMRSSQWLCVSDNNQCERCPRHGVWFAERLFSLCTNAPTTSFSTA